MKRLSALLIFLLTGCATQGGPLPGPDEVRAQFQRGPVVVSPVQKPVSLAERTKSAAVGNFIVASVASSVAGSAGASTNPSAMQANMDISQQFGRELNRALPSSYEAGTNVSADVAVAQRLASRFQWAGPEVAPGAIKLSVQAKKWELGYESFVGTSDYLLNYDLEVSATEQSGEKPRVISRVSCAGQAVSKMPLEQWKADNYRAVREAVDVISAQCLDKALKTYGVL